MTDSHFDPGGVGHPDEARLRELAQEFVDRYMKRQPVSERHGGCGWCGGLPHTVGCLVGRMEAVFGQPVPLDTGPLPMEAMLQSWDREAAYYESESDETSSLMAKTFRTCIVQVRRSWLAQLRQPVPPPGAVPAAHEQALIDARVDGHGDGQEHAIADVNAGLVDHLIAPRLDRLRAELAAVPAAQDARHQIEFTSAQLAYLRKRLCEMPIWSAVRGFGEAQERGGLAMVRTDLSNLIDALPASHPSRQEPPNGE